MIKNYISLEKMPVRAFQVPSPEVSWEVRRVEGVYSVHIPVLSARK